jgi:hypothetical protein
MNLPSPRRLLAVASTALVLGLTAHGAATHAPAQPRDTGVIAPLADASLNCEPFPTSVLCDLSVSTPAVGTLTIRWIVNGTLRSSLNDQTTIIVGCATGQRMNIVAVVTDDCGTDRPTASEVCGITPRTD